MAEDVDVSALAELVRIRHDEDLLRERLDRMEARRASVSDVVYRRVKDDYEARKSSLEAEAREPRARAGREYAKLRVLTGEATRLLDEARLAREEVDFRHELGEFEEATFEERRKQGEELLGERQARVDELARLKERFLEAFHNEEELERAAGPAGAPAARRPEPSASKAAPPEPAPEKPRPEPRLEAPPGAGTIKGALDEMLGVPPPCVTSGPVAAPPTTIMPPPPVPLPVPPPPVVAGGRGGATVLPPPPAFSPDATVAGPPHAGPGFSPDATALAPGGVAVAVPSAPAEQRSATIQMQVARVLVVQDDGQGPEYVLRPEPTSVGRAPESTIRLAYPDVSRQHAMIFPVEGGFKIADRGSPNGLFVNGARVKEHLLSDGDVIQVGRRKLVFRT